MTPESLSPIWADGVRESCNHLWQSTLFVGIVALLALLLLASACPGPLLLVLLSVPHFWLGKLVRRSPRNLKIACDHAGLTLGGVYFFHEFLQLLQFRDVLARHIVYPRRNCRYTVAQMMLALIYPIVWG